MIPAPLLTLHRVSVAYGALRAVDGVSLAVRTGERRAIIGPNGAGKTTLFNAIAGELPCSSGRIELLGRDITRLRVHRRAALGIGRTYQITNLFGDLTVEENVRLAVRGPTRRKFSFFGSDRSGGGEEQGEVEGVLAVAGIQGRRGTVTKTLSYGEQRQLELALALAGKPRLLLLDEPAAGLSAAERARMAQIIRELPADLSMVLIEHDIELALGLTDYVTCLHFGQVLTEGKPDAIRNDVKVQEVYLGRPHHA
ncbi:MAG: ABC transporter ATP-binding protein [Myxococcales bacterium]